MTLSTRQARGRKRVLGLAIAHARNDDAVLQANPEARRAETVIELTGRIPLAENLDLQPDLQWVHHPGALPSRNAAVVAAIRVHARF